MINIIKWNSFLSNNKNIKVAIILIPSIFFSVMTIYSFPKSALHHLKDRLNVIENN